MATRPVLIVGGGAAGLSAAVAFAQAGVRSTVLEATSGRSSIDRGDVIHVSSQRLLQRLRLWDRIDALDPHRFSGFHIFDGGGRCLFDADIADATGGGVFCSLRHERLVGLLHEVAAQSPLIDIRLGEHVKRLLYESGRVVGALTVSEEHRSPLTVVAAGGQTSILDDVTRSWRRDYQVTFYNCDVEADLPSDAGLYVLGDADVVVVVPLGGNRFRIGLQVRRATTIDEAAALDRMCRLYRPLAGASAQVFGGHRYPLRARWTYRWSGPGFAAVGDAAHTVHPVGGQGMNLAFTDAAALAVEVGRVGTDDVDRATARFAARRRREVAPVAALTHILGLIASRPELPVARARNASVRVLGRSATVRSALMRLAAGR